ncbi:hypothetical protein OESDEN_22996 [Oesophagostomum dentatum]|uniref:Uncharacterized protein n=1 Tax=Oesophagostomum dentatum TaxID=61180 RepID=A0A0B1RXH0_OESDE|nr:hypothetical protein OESDEN_22996 [Oesophagostomum dentatum]
MFKVPLASETTPGTPTATTSTGATMVPTIVGVTAPSVATVTTATTPAAPPTQTATAMTTGASTTAEASTTTTPSTTTTTTAIARDVPAQASPYRCVSCCQPNPVNCRPQVININLSYPPQNRRLNKGCQNNFQCPRGLLCLQGACR